MTDTAPQPALREWRAHMARPVRLAALVGAAVILTLVAPFGTGDAMRALPRLAYWTVLVGLSYSAGYLGFQVAQRLAPARLFSRMLIAGAVTGLLVLLLVYGLNGLTLGYWATGRELALLAGNVVLISTIMAVIFQLAYAEEDKDAPKVAAPPALLDRLPLDKRGDLVALSVEDHYVRIRTVKGEEMVLMRLSDAMREVGEAEGLQVHRSHWAALRQITAVTRRGDGAQLSMTHGPDIPVSRANMAKLRAARLLPKSMRGATDG